MCLIVKCTITDNFLTEVIPNVGYLSKISPKITIDGAITINYGGFMFVNILSFFYV